ncbi:putative capsular polysaccharide synthesis family protein [Myxosarcina sp. GI1(2024)]
MHKTVARILPNYSTNKLYYSWKFELSKAVTNIFGSNLSQPEVIVYQMGKVGSSTIVKSLQKLDLDFKVYHVHALSEQRIEELENTYRAHFDRTRVIHSHLLESLYLRKQIKRNERQQKWKVITLVRDPIARNFSSFFQNVQHQRGYDWQKKLHTSSPDVLSKELQKIFLENLDNNFKILDLDWFDRELKTVFGVDVFAKKFDPDKGYEIYQGEKADVLLLKLETLNRCANNAFREFLQLENFTLSKKNIGRNKLYKQVYKSFLNDIKLPEAYIEEMYTSQFVRHFYSNSEINYFTNRWRKIPTEMTRN